MDDTWDVIVVGGGPAGCAAAASAAEQGAKTLLVEASCALGGMGTSGLVPAWTPFWDEEKIIYKGIAEKIFKECKAGMPHIEEDDLDWVSIDPERLKRIYDELVINTGAQVLFRTMLSAVECEVPGVVDAIIVSNKSGLSALKAKVYIDCTGDADLAVWAGCDFEKGDPETGELQPATHCFILSNVDMNAYHHGPAIRYDENDNVIDKIIASNQYPEIKDKHICPSHIGPGTVGFNAGHIWEIDNTDPKSVSGGLIEGRRIADAFHRALTEHFPEAFGNSFLVATAPLLGTRETRRIIGDYVLTLDDFLARKSFPDEICRNCYMIDIHNAGASSEDYKKAERKMQELSYKKGESHGIPYRCLTPKNLKNVLVAGRSISTDRSVQGSVRVMAVCICTGEAAGTAAAMALENVDVHQVDTDELRKRLVERGVYLQ